MIDKLKAIWFIIRSKYYAIVRVDGTRTYAMHNLLPDEALDAANHLAYTALEKQKVLENLAANVQQDINVNDAFLIANEKPKSN